MIAVTQSVTIAAPKASVFALLDDVTTTPRWLSRCVRVEAGPPLQYYLREGGGHVGVWQGTVTARAPNDHLTLVLAHKLAEVCVEQTLATTNEGTVLTCSIRVAPRSLAGKLMTPLIRKHLPTVIAKATANLKALCEAPQERATTAAQHGARDARLAVG